jgi:hypothetical protein
MAGAVQEPNLSGRLDRLFNKCDDPGEDVMTVLSIGGRVEFLNELCTFGCKVVSVGEPLLENTSIVEIKKPVDRAKFHNGRFHMAVVNHEMLKDHPDVYNKMCMWLKGGARMLVSNADDSVAKILDEAGFCFDYNEGEWIQAYA